jgi:hypothetical protein
MIKIDKDIPPPLSGKVIGVLLNKMQVGESCLIPNFTPSVKSSLHGQMRNLSPSKEFTSRVTGNYIRVWRIA